MKRLAFAVMTGVGYYLHKEWKKRKQLHLSESSLREAEKLLYSHFEEFEAYGWEISEHRNKQHYSLRLTNNKNASVVMTLWSSKKLKCLVMLNIDEKSSLHDINDFLSARDHQPILAKDFSSFDTYTMVLSNRLKNELIEGYVFCITLLNSSYKCNFC